MVRVVIWSLSCHNLGEHRVQVEGDRGIVDPKSVGEIRVYGVREIETMIEKFIIAVRVEGFVFLGRCITSALSSMSVKGVVGCFNGSPRFRRPSFR